MVAIWVLPLAALLATVVIVVRSTGVSTQPQSPTQVLAQRLARGEIDEAEYRSRLAQLREQ